MQAPNKELKGNVIDLKRQMDENIAVIEKLKTGLEAVSVWMPGEVKLGTRQVQDKASTV